MSHQATLCVLRLNFAPLREMIFHAKAQRGKTKGAKKKAHETDFAKL
jgi:hypothetical protein